MHRYCSGIIKFVKSQKKVGLEKYVGK